MKIFIQDAIMERWREDFDEGNRQHDMVLKATRFNLGGTYWCEAVNHERLDKWERWEAQVYVGGRMH